MEHSKACGSQRGPGHEAKQHLALEPLASSTKQQVQDHQQHDETKPTATVVAHPGAHVIAAAAEEYKKDHENEYERHARKSSIAISSASLAGVAANP